MTEKQRCAVVEDLFAAYQEKLTNETTSNMIKEHLKKCKKCAKKYEDYLFQIEEDKLQEEKISQKFYHKLRRYRYQLVGMVLGIVLTLLGMAGGVLFLWFYAKQASTTNSYTEAVEDYGKFEDYEGISGLYLFPSKNQIDVQKADIERYVYECYGNRTFQTCQIYLECSYSKEGYQAEKERVKKVKGEENKTAIESEEDDFSYPGVYAMLNSEACYEYVLFVEKEQKIIYVYLQGAVDRRELKFSEQYLPLEYGQNGNSPENEKTYSIYSSMEETVE